MSVWRFFFVTIAAFLENCHLVSHPEQTPSAIKTIYGNKMQWGLDIF